MNSSTNIFKDVPAYIATFSGITQKHLKQMRVTIKKTAPDAVEGIAYGMPAYKQNDKPLAYFAAFKNHIGFYATPNSHTAFKKELAKYKQGKGSVQFPIDEPLPLSLVTKMVAFNLKKISSNPPKKKSLKK